MGRGRAKAKQAKVARALKYGGPQTDLERLQQELAGVQPSGGYTPSADDDDDDEFDADLYSKYLDEEDDEDEER